MRTHFNLLQSSSRDKAWFPHIGLFAVGLLTLAVGIPYSRRWYLGGMEAEVQAYGELMVVSSSLLLLLAPVLLLASDLRGGRWLTSALMMGVALLHLPPAVAWLLFQGAMTDHSPGFGPLGALQHVAVIVLCVAVLRHHLRSLQTRVRAT